MNAEDPKTASLKQKAVHELEEMLVIFLYLGFFFCAISTYSMLLLNQFQVSYFTYGAALINALVVAKVILIGEYAHLGKKHEDKPLFQSALYKSVLYSLLVFVFHVVEEIIKRLVHGEELAKASQHIRVDELLARSLVVFCTFLSFFAFRELRRVMGDESFKDLFFRTGQAAKSELPGKA